MLRLTAFTLLLATSLGAARPATAAEPFTLVDHLGRNWQNERVRFPLSPAEAARARATAALTDTEGRAVPFEIVGNGSSAAIEFLADLPPFGRASYRFASAVPPAPSDLALESDDGQIRIRNHLGGIAIRRHLKNDEAPIAGLRLADGSWVGASTWRRLGDPVTAYETTVERQGPVAAVVVCRTTFASGLVWRLRVTMQAGDAAVLLEEHWSQWTHPEVELAFASPLRPTRIHYRVGKPDAAGKNLSKVATDEISALPPADPVFELVPWLHWWLSARRGTWFAAYDEQHQQALVFAAYRADLWLSEADGALGRKLAPLAAIAREDGLTLVLPATGRHRHWLLALVPRQAAVDAAQVGKLGVETPAQRLVVRHGDFPLDRVKDLPLVWNRSRTPHTRLFLTPDDVDRLARLPRTPQSLARFNGVRLSFPALVDFVDHYLRSGDARIGAEISRAAVTEMQAAVDMFLRQDRLMSLGFAPTMQRQILYAVHLADFGLADEFLTSDEKAKLRAQAAFLGHVVHRGDYWSPARGFAANPNMTSIVAGFQGMIACLVDDHPLARGWFDAAIKEFFDNQLLTWSDANGGWLEAPHYAMLSFDHMLGVFLCARKFGLAGTYLDHPRLKLMLEWFAKISTPPDQRIGGRRHHPPIGNTYMLETTDQFGTAAYLWRRTDPQLSARMQWMHRQSGGSGLPGVGGFWPALAPYQKVLKDITLPAQRPDYRSELFPQTGAILRHHFGGERETQLHIVAGSNHAHYDYDSGSITIWGKGRLIADDFGYEGRAPASDHSMVDSPHAAATMQPEAFAAGPHLDYFRGRSGGWTRHVLMIKDQDPLGPNYYVLRDRLVGQKGGRWRLWLTGASVRQEPPMVRVVGSEDVDTDIALLSDKALPAVLETISRRSGSSGLQNNPMTTTQTSVILTLPGPDQAMSTLVYPRHKNEPEPLMSQALNGRVVTLRSQHGTDTIFVSGEQFSYQRDGISFEGTIGAVLDRFGRRQLVLGAPGTIAAGDERLTAGADSFPAVAR